MRMKNLSSKFLSSIFPQPVWAPDDFNGIPTEGDEPEPFSDESFIGQGDDDDEKNDEIIIEENDPLSELYSGVPDEDAIEPDSFNAAEVQKGLVAQMQADIAAFDVTDDMFPEGFNPSNRDHLKVFSRNLGQQIIRNALNTMFKPTQASMERLAANNERQIRESMRDFKVGGKTQDQLVAAIPMMGDPNARRVIKPMFDQAMRLHKNDVPKAIAATKKAMTAMSMNPNARPVNKSAPTNKARKTGLDLYLPRVPPAPSGSDRTRQGLTRPKQQ